jgi:hypothetical protein
VQCVQRRPVRVGYYHSGLHGVTSMCGGSGGVLLIDQLTSIQNFHEMKFFFHEVDMDNQWLLFFFLKKKVLVKKFQRFAIELMLN